MKSPSLQYHLQGVQCKLEREGCRRRHGVWGGAIKKRFHQIDLPFSWFFSLLFFIPSFFFLILISAHERKENHVALADAIKTLKNRPLFSSALTPSPFSFLYFPHSCIFPLHLLLTSPQFLLLLLISLLFHIAINFKKYHPLEIPL